MEAALRRGTSTIMTSCTLGEMMIAALARTIKDGTLAFHGFGSPLVQLAMHVAKRTHAPRMAMAAGATYGLDPEPPFLAPTSNDWMMDRSASCSLGIEELFDLAAAGRMGRMFLSGLQIDQWGNCNVISWLPGHHVEIARPRRELRSCQSRRRIPRNARPRHGCRFECTRGIEHAVQYRLAEWTAMVESAPFIDTSSVAMRVDVHEAYWRQLRARSGT
jgi:hypothetical protein